MCDTSDCANAEGNETQTRPATLFMPHGGGAPLCAWLTCPAEVLPRRENPSFLSSSAKVEWLRPGMSRQELAQRCGTVQVEDHLGVDIGRVDLTDELPAPAARGQHVQARRVVTPHGDDPLDPVVAGRHHRRDGTVLGAEARAGAGVDAHPARSEEHTSELQSQFHLVCRLLLEK